MNKFVKTNIPEKDIVSEYLMAINGLTKLTKKELELMSILVSMDINYVFTDKYEVKNIANAVNRKIIMKKVGMTRDNLSTYLKRLRNKGVLIATKHGELTVIKELKPTVAGDTVQILLVLKSDKHED